MSDTEDIDLSALLDGCAAWDIVSAVEPPVVGNALCEKCGGPAIAAGRCAGYACPKSVCESCHAKTDLRYQCRRCLTCNTGGILYVNSKPRQMLYCMMHVTDASKRHASLYLRTENGTPCRLSGYSDIGALYSTYELKKTENRAANQLFAQAPKHVVELKTAKDRMSKQLHALHDAGLPYHSRYKVVPKIGVVAGSLGADIGNHRKLFDKTYSEVVVENAENARTSSLIPTDLAVSL